MQVARNTANSDPLRAWLEEYSCGRSHAPSIKDFADFFSSGNWAIRQGVLFGDLAFIQQVNDSDEWWTPKRRSKALIPRTSAPCLSR